MFVGIDPGLRGSVGWISSEGRFIGVADTPVAHIESSNGKKHEYAARDMAHIFISHGGILGANISEVSHVFIEEQQAMPGQGVRSMFTIGFGFGLWIGILSSSGIPYTRVRPLKWKKALGLSKDKEQSRLRAQQLFPEAPLGLKKHDGRAEALLLAWYGWREIGRQIQQP